MLLLPTSFISNTEKLKIHIYIYIYLTGLERRIILKLYLSNNEYLSTNEFQDFFCGKLRLLIPRITPNQSTSDVLPVFISIINLTYQRESVTIRSSNTLKNPSIWPNGRRGWRFSVPNISLGLTDAWIGQGKKRRKFIGKCREGEKKRPTRKESSVCKSELKRAAIHPLEWTSYTHCVRKRREKKTESMNRCHDTAIQSEYKACSKRKSATAGIKKGVFFVPPPRTMRNTLRRVENNLTRSLAGLHCCSRGSVTSLHENWSDVIGSNTWDKNLGIGKFHGLLLAS